MSWISDGKSFRNFLSIVLIGAPDFDDEDDLDLDEAFSQLRAALDMVVPPDGDRPGAETALDAAYNAYLRDEPRAGAQLVLSLDSLLFTSDGLAPAASIGSYGGPRVVLPMATADLWRGVPDAGLGGQYQLACEVGELGIIEPWKQPLVVLGCAPLDMFAIQEDTGVLLYAWEFGPDDATVRALAESADAEAEWGESVTFESGGGSYVVIDAAVAWEERDEHLQFDLSAGRYEVRQTYLERGDAAVTAYRIRRTG